MQFPSSNNISDRLLGNVALVRLRAFGRDWYVFYVAYAAMTVGFVALFLDAFVRLGAKEFDREPVTRKLTMEGLSHTMRILAVLGLGLALIGCQSLREATGAAKQPPDEFTVLTKAPLVIPPDFNLRQPQPNVVARNEVVVDKQARHLLFQNSDSGVQAAALGANYSDGEKTLLAKAGALSVDPIIRRQMGANVGQEGQGVAFSQHERASMIEVVPMVDAGSSAPQLMSAPRQKRTLLHWLFPEVVPAPTSMASTLVATPTTAATAMVNVPAVTLVPPAMASEAKDMPAPRQKRTLLRWLFPEVAPASVASVPVATLSPAAAAMVNVPAVTLVPPAMASDPKDMPAPRQKRTLLRWLFPEVAPAPASMASAPVATPTTTAAAMVNVPALTPVPPATASEPKDMPALRQKRTLLRWLFPEVAFSTPKSSN